MKNLIVKLLVSCVLCVISVGAAIADDTSYSFAVVPQQSAKELAKRWGPIFRYIHQQSGVRLQFKTAKNIPEFERKLAAGEYDFAYMNPYHFTVFNQEPGYQAVAVRRDQPIRGIIVVRKDSPVTSLADLSGKTLAFPSPAAFAASMLPRAELKKKYLSFSAKYVSSHDSVYLNVAKGLFPAGGGVKRTFNNMDPQVRDQLKVLWVTEPYTPHAIAVHPDVDLSVVMKVQAALVDMSENPNGLALLKSLKIKHGLKKAINSDWDDVRDLGLQQLDNLIK